MLVLWDVYLGHSRRDATNLATVGIAIAKRGILAYRDGGLEGFVHCDPGPQFGNSLEAVQAAGTQRLVHSGIVSERERETLVTARGR
jgi:hypothetical protein